MVEITRRRFLSGVAATVVAATESGCNRANPSAGGGADKGQKPLKPNIIVYLADTLRADHLGCYGHAISPSPHIDAFASKSFVFEQCSSVSPWTKPTIASLATGVLPRVHQACISNFTGPKNDEANVQHLREKFTTLAESLKAQGYFTGMFTCNPHVKKNFGFGQGYDTFHFRLAQSARWQMMEVGYWIEKAPEPFFLFIHERDPHGPYQPTSMKYKAVFHTSLKDDESNLSEQDRVLIKQMRFHYGNLDIHKPDLTKLSDAGCHFIQRLYDAEIFEVDGQFDEMLAQLDQHEIADRTAIVFTADHGEAFNEHGQYYHGTTLYDEMIQVPLIIRLPGQTKGVRVPHTVSLLDLHATLLTLAGSPYPDYIQSRPLFGDSGQLRVTEDWEAFSDLDHARRDTEEWNACMIQGRYKVTTFGHIHRLVVFDRHEDPRETVNILDDARAEDTHVKQLLRRFEQAQAEHATLAAQFGEAQWSLVGRHFQDELEALGYLE